METGNNSTELQGNAVTRLPQYKCRPDVTNQEIRRVQLLQEQKRKREDSYNSVRNLAEIFPEDGEENGEKEGEEEISNQPEEFMEWTVEKPKLPRLKDMFMFSEWMVHLPEDLEQNWFFVPCPVGKRCLVRGAKGCTTVYGTQGHQLARFQSSLPGGGARGCNRPRHSSSEVTILDCIWSSLTKTYYVLDVLCWRDMSYLDSDTAFRNFWIKSKISEEMPWLMQASQSNPYPFVLLEYYPCDPCIISSVMCRYPYFQRNEPCLDGILFYHREVCYMPGSTPLVVWLKPFMLPEMLGSSAMISEEYFKTRPVSYVNMSDYIVKYEAKHKQNAKKRRSRRKKIQQPDDEMDEDESLVAGNVCEETPITV